MPLVAVQLPLILSVAILVFIATMRIDDKIEKINSKYFVVFVRHGQSVANQRSISSGWLDTPLTEKGICISFVYLVFFFRALITENC